MAQVNLGQVARVAEFLKTQPAGDILNFHSFGGHYAADYYPDIAVTETEKEEVINFFFLWGLHNWGFWYHDENSYVAPMYGICKGKRKKGAELWSCALMKAFREDKIIVKPGFLANITPEIFGKLFCDDNGPIVWPNFNKRYAMTKEYAQTFVSRTLEDSLYPRSPLAIVKDANGSRYPLEHFLEDMSTFEGYSDPFQKRSILLAMALANRPEHFLKVQEDESWPPIIDYHLMRLALRTGVVKIDTVAEENRNSNRRLCPDYIEWGIRQASYDVFKQLIELSGRSMFDIDHLFWSGRRYCAEETEPDCNVCPLNSVCERNTQLFQPVFETDAY